MRTKAKFKRGDIIVSYVYGGKMSHILEIVGRNATSYLLEFWHPTQRQSNFWSGDIKDTERFYDALNKKELELLRMLM